MIVIARLIVFAATIVLMVWAAQYGMRGDYIRGIYCLAWAIVFSGLLPPPRGSRP